MNSLHYLRPVIAGLFLVFATAFPAAAQNYAADLLRQGMESRGAYHGYQINADTYYPILSGVEFKGLRVSWALMEADREYAWGLVYFVENLTNRPYCIRPKMIDDMPQGKRYFVQHVNQIVEPHGKLQIVNISDDSYRPNGSARHPTFAFWPPNYDAPDGSQCRSVAPEGLQEWVDNGQATWFRRSRRD